MIGDNAWLDGFVRVAVIVGLTTIMALALIYLERKVIGRIQMRLGPMRTGPFGVLQTPADMVKLLTKEDLRPSSAERWVFELAPIAVFVPVLLTLVALPFTDTWGVRVLDLGLFYFIAVGALSILGYIMAGWASDNKYAMLGAMRAAAQLISYEVPLVLAVLALAMVAGTLNLVEIVEGQGRVPFAVWQPLAFVIFLAGSYAEMFRRPFDIPVAESEVVGGPWIEYSGIRWGMLFALPEFTNLFGLSVFGGLIFLGGWDWPLGRELGWWWQVILVFVKTSLLILLAFWVSATFPRLRIDQLMNFCWKLLLPMAFLQIFLNGLILVYDWPDWTLLLTSGLALAALAYIVYLETRLPPSVRALTSGAPRGAAEPTPSAGGG